MKSDTMKVVSTSSRRVESPPFYFEDFNNVTNSTGLGPVVGKPNLFLFSLSGGARAPLIRRAGLRHHQEVYL
jgi:hypothetical protein